MSDTKSFQIAPEQASFIKSQMGSEVVWEENGTISGATVSVQGVDLYLSYNPPVLEVTLLHKPWYASKSTVWQKLTDYIYQGLN